MPSNTSKGEAFKGSKKWIQQIVKAEHTPILLNELSKEDSNIKKIIWHSPNHPDYIEDIKLNKYFPLVNFDFWTSLGPHWDAIGETDDGTILLVEAKANIAEVKTKCSASSNISKEKIRKALNDTFDALKIENLSFSDYIWLQQYYQISNRLAYLHNLKKQKQKAKLLLIYFCNDYTNISTTLNTWVEFNRIMWDTLGINKPKEVYEIYLDVNDIKL